MKPTKRRHLNKAASHKSVGPDLMYGLHAVQAALEVANTRVQQIWLAADRQDKRTEKLLVAARSHGVLVHQSGREMLNEMLPGVQHQDCVARCKPLQSLDEKGLFHLLDELTESPMLLVLDGVQDPHNLGACLRTAEAAGVHAVIAPKDRASGLTATAIKVSTGSAERVPFVQVSNLSRVMRELQQRGIWLVGAAGDAPASLFECRLNGPLAIVFGAEGKGIRRLTRENCDEVIYIPMLGQTESLNVSVAAGVCLFEAFRQRLLSL